MRLALTLAFTLGFAPQGFASGNGDGPPPGVSVVNTTLEAVRTAPDAFKSVWVRFPAQFCSMGKVANPFFTRFVPSDYANFYVWSEQQPIWRKEQYDDMFGMLFMSKENEQLYDLYQLQLYDRVMVTGCVRNTFQGQPWIEVTNFEVQSQKVDTATLAHLYRGEYFMARRQWQRAISELSLAPGATAPQDVVAAIHKNLGVCYLRMGESGLATQHLTTAASLLEQDREAVELLQMAQMDPSKALDREVDRSQIPDYQRPMWEAFEELSTAPAPGR